jgi:hypothetical protein
MIVKKIDDCIVPPHYCEVSYLNEMISFLEKELDDRFVLCVIYEELYKYENIIDENEYKDKIKIAIHVGNETIFKNKFYDSFDYIFRFYLSEFCDYKKVFPINIGYNSSGRDSVNFFSNKKIINRNYDCFFSGQINNHNRISLVNKISKLKNDKNFYGTTKGFRQGLEIDDYVQIMSNSKISLVPKGVSPETFRFTESFASGCVVITTEKLNVWYYDNCPAIFLDSWESLTQELIDEILQRDLELESQKSLDYYKNFLSAESNSKYILNTVLKEKIIKNDTKKETEHSEN